ncbi:MAG: DUF1573 domain-containing protein [Verrucomicrobia bacterium]|nr:DUF1573 domain-containing protein [Verrucomicrobiota bacterium]
MPTTRVFAPTSVICAWLLFAACVAWAAAPPAVPAGRIAFDEPGFNFGVMDQQTEATHVFTLRNTGAGPLRILQVFPGCSCAATELDSSDIPPGGSARLMVTFYSGNFNGAVHKTMTVQSSDPARPMATLELRADVQPVFIFTPAVLDLGPIERGQTATREVTMSDAKGRPFAIKSISSSLTNLTATAAAPGRDGSTHRLKVALAPQSRTGPLVGNVEVTTDRKVAGKPILLVIGSVVGPVRVTPTAIFLGLVGPGETFPPKKLTVQNTGPKPVEIKAVDPGDPVLKAMVTTNAPGREFTVELTTRRAPAPGWMRRTLHIFTSDSDAPLEVSLSGIVRKNTEAGAK